LVCLRVARVVVGLAGRLDLKQVAHTREGLASVALGEKAVVMMWTASPERHQVQRRDRWQVADREAVHEDLYQDWSRPGEELFSGACDRA
jgi:hypothetical protein